MSTKTLAKIQQTRSAIMETPEMEAHIQRWGLSFIRAKTLVINDEGKFLTVEEKRARIDGVWRDVKDIWNFPGGSISCSTENIFATARREVREETGYEIELSGFLGMEQKTIYNDPCVIFLFTGRPISESAGQIDAKEIWRYEWLSEAEVLQLYQQDKMRSKELNLRMLKSRYTAMDLSAVTYR